MIRAKKNSHVNGHCSVAARAYGKEQKRNQRNEEDASRNRTTVHRVSIVPTVIVLNLSDCCSFLDCSAQDPDTAYSRQILQS
jgi:hypothetical protein